MKNGFDFGLDKYPIFDENYRPILNNAILEYYKFRDICCWNPILWRDRLLAKLDRIMRNKYNELYKNKMLEFNPLYNIDITETFDRTNKNTSNLSKEDNTTNTSSDSSTSSASSNINNTSKGYSTNYPVSSLGNELDSDIYADTGGTSQTNESNSTSGNTSSNSQSSYDANSTSVGTSNDEESYTRHTIGSSAGLPFSKAMIQFKEFVSKFNLDQQVIDELADLFIQIY